MGTVVGLSGFLARRMRSQSAAALAGSPGTGFTRRDQADLDDWSVDGRRSVVCSSDAGSFAMLYEAGQVCASWGVVRQGGRILVWDCVTLADIDRHDTMADALTALGDDAAGDDRVSSDNVVPFIVDRGRQDASRHP